MMHCDLDLLNISEQEISNQQRRFENDENIVIVLVEHEFTVKVM